MGPEFSADEERIDVDASPPLRRSLEAPAAVGGVLVIVLILGAMAFGMDRVPFDALAGFITLLVLVALTMPFLTWLARSEGQRASLNLLTWGMVATVTGMLVRYFFVTVVYGDEADAGVYSDGAIALVKLFRAGVFTMIPPGLETRPAESQRIAVVLAVVYLFTGASRWAGTFVFAWIAFIGRLLMWRAFKRAVPEGDHDRYLRFVLFFPSLLFWPSSLGKEAMMILALGVVSYGAAQLFSDRVSAGAIVTFLAGVAGLLFVRPHMAAIAVAALGLSSVVGALGSLASTEQLKSTAVRTGALIVLIAVSGIVFTQMSTFFGEDQDTTDQGVGGVLDRTLEQTSVGGSKFDPPVVSTPLDLPFATLTVIARPFPWEARNPNSFMAGLEGTALLVMFIAGRRRLLTAGKLMFKRPYLLFVSAFVLTFIVAFSYFGNFGILARQRTQVLPLLFVFLCFPPTAAGRSLLGRRRRRSGRPAGEATRPMVGTLGTDQVPNRSAPQPVVSPVHSSARDSALGRRRDLNSPESVTRVPAHSEA